MWSNDEVAVASGSVIEDVRAAEERLAPLPEQLLDAVFKHLLVVPSDLSAGALCVRARRVLAELRASLLLPHRVAVDGAVEHNTRPEKHTARQMSSCGGVR